MEVKVLKDEGNVLEIEVGSMTLVEILRVYANQNGADVAAWKRDHPSKNPILHVEGKNPKAIVKKAIEAIGKDVDSAVDEFKKLK